MRITNHRRFTANHTWHVRHADRWYFVKANPNPDEAQAERLGHARLDGHYPVPHLRSTRRLGGWTILTYDLWPHLARDRGLLLDEIARADLTENTDRLDACLTAVLRHYRHVTYATVHQTTHGETIGKLYADRAAPGGRLDRYYKPDAPWLVTDDGQRLCPSQLAAASLIINGAERALDMADLLEWLRRRLAPGRPVWAAVTQGDPTDFNIGWSPAAGPVWFDYDTGGVNSLPGEFACFLLYQRLHGAWLTPRYNRTAFRDHPAALTASNGSTPTVHTRCDDGVWTIHYQHRPSSARRWVLGRYLDEIVRPIAHDLGIEDVMDWLRPYLVMRLLAVYNLADLGPTDAALCLALVTEALDPRTTLADFLALAPDGPRTVFTS